MRSLSQRIVDSSFKDPVAYVQPAHPTLVELHPDDENLQRQIVLPGAHRAVTHKDLEGWQRDGLSQHEMLSRVNERWDAANVSRVREFEGWRSTEYADRVQRAQERQAERLRRLQAAGLAPRTLG